MADPRYVQHDLCIADRSMHGEAIGARWTDSCDRECGRRERRGGASSLYFVSSVQKNSWVKNLPSWGLSSLMLGAKALRAAINKVFWSQHPVQRCRNQQDSQRLQPPVRGTESVGESGDACQLQTGGEGRHVSAEKAGGLIGAGMSGGHEQFAGRIGGMFHDQSLGHSPSLHRCLATD